MKKLSLVLVMAIVMIGTTSCLKREARKYHISVEELKFAKAAHRRGQTDPGASSIRQKERILQLGGTAPSR